jgi:hypothetical protein
MGLTINYELRLSGTTTTDRVLELLRQLNAKALTLKLDAVSPVCRLTVSDLADDSDWRPTGVDWLVHFTATGLCQERDSEDAALFVDPNELAAVGFAVYPGEGSEAAGFGFVQPRVPESSWFWQGFCKTQYASSVSDEHFVFCHLAIIALLDEAVRLGIDVTVYDEAGYWESRSTDALLREVHRMNKLVAHFAGALHDASLKVEAPIFENRDFERLETEPL